MSLHLKRLNAPRSWHIPRKTGGVFVPKPMPGAHAVENSIPLAIIVRDYLGYAESGRLVSQVLATREVLLDGKPAWSPKQGVGLMDVVSIPKLDVHYRMLMDRRGRLTLVDAPAAQAAWKLCRVVNKHVVPGGKFQVNLHDGRNVLVKDAASVKTGDVVKLQIPEQKILATYPMEQGAMAFITGGAHAGETARVESQEITLSPKENLVNLSSGDAKYGTLKRYVFVIGKDKSEIKLPEVNA